MPTTPLATPPLAVFGTMEREGDAECIAVARSVSEAIVQGYRHFDTAELYTTTQAVGRSLTAATAASGLHRHDLYITSKVRGIGVGMKDAEEASYDQIRARVETLIADLQVGYLDLLLLHWPGPDTVDMVQSGEVEEKCNLGFYEQHIEAAWKNMLQLKQDGLVLNVGVSNFYRQHLQILVKLFPNDPPFANQIYIDACHHEEEYLQYLRSEVGVQHVFAYRPLVFTPVYAMLEDVSETLSKIATTLTANPLLTTTTITMQQAILTWLIHRGIHPVCASTNTAHIAQNFAAVALADAVSTTDGENFNFGAAFASLDKHEMVDMYGGCDEYAAMFRRLGAVG